jgi:hypothetical protein
VRQRAEKYYEQFGFQDVNLADLPGDFYREYLIGKVITTLIAIVTFRNLNIIPLGEKARFPAGMLY